MTTRKSGLTRQKMKSLISKIVKSVFIVASSFGPPLFRQVLSIFGRYMSTSGFWSFQWFSCYAIFWRMIHCFWVQGQKEKEKGTKGHSDFFSLYFLCRIHYFRARDKRFSWSGWRHSGWYCFGSWFDNIIGLSTDSFVRQNSYASRVVEVDKGQKAITTGLYNFVRHPHVPRSLAMYMPSPVALGSYLDSFRWLEFHFGDSTKNIERRKSIEKRPAGLCRAL